jgi:dUTP pyrophosphatase
MFYRGWIVIINFKRLRDSAKIPCFGHNDSTNAGLDLFLPEGCVLEPGEARWIGTGVAWEPGVVMVEEPFAESVVRGKRLYGWKPALLIRPRSSVADRDLEITEGTVDSGYRGEIKIHVINRGKLYRSLEAGYRIAQALPVLVPEIMVQEVETLSVSDRGDRGFGSSGK